MHEQRGEQRNRFVNASSKNYQITSRLDEDEAVQVFIEPLEQYKSKALRKEIYRLKLKVIKKGPDLNDHKKGYIALLREYRNVNGGSEQTPTVRVSNVPTLTTFQDMMEGTTSALINTTSNVAHSKTIVKKTGVDDILSTVELVREHKVSMKARLLQIILTEPFRSRLINLHHSIVDERKKTQETVAAMYAPGVWRETHKFWREVSSAWNNTLDNSDIGIKDLDALSTFEAWKSICKSFNYTSKGLPCTHKSCGEWSLDSAEFSFMKKAVTEIPVLSLIVHYMTITEHCTNSVHFSNEPFPDPIPVHFDSQPAIVPCEATEDQRSSTNMMNEDGLCDSIDGENRVQRYETGAEMHAMGSKTKFDMPLSELMCADGRMIKLQSDQLHLHMSRTTYWEGRLATAKRKIIELESEMKALDKNAGSNDLKIELNYYTRERKRALYSLVNDA